MMQEKIKKINQYLDDNYKFVFQLMGLIAIVFSMYTYSEETKKQRLSEEKSYDWRRKELTQERLEIKREKKNSYETSIKKYSKALEEDASDDVAQDKIIKFTRKLFNLYEGISRGVNIGIYDVNIVDMTWGTAMLKLYTNNKVFLAEVRKKNKNAWSQFEKVIKIIEPLHKEQVEEFDSEEEEQDKKVDKTEKSD